MPQSTTFLHYQHTRFYARLLVYLPTELDGEGEERGGVVHTLINRESLKSYVQATLCRGWIFSIRRGFSQPRIKHASTDFRPP